MYKPALICCQCFLRLDLKFYINTYSIITFSMKSGICSFAAYWESKYHYVHEYILIYLEFVKG